jgi:hypothetical protein
MRYFLLATLVCFAGPALGAQQSAVVSARADCSLTRPASRPQVLPDTVYVTWVLNGEVLLRRQRQIVRGPHSVVALDSMPAPLNPSEIEAIEFPIGEAARRWEACPTVRVVTIRTRSEIGPPARLHTSRPAAQLSLQPTSGRRRLASLTTIGPLAVELRR